MSNATGRKGDEIYVLYVVAMAEPPEPFATRRHGVCTVPSLGTISNYSPLQTRHLNCRRRESHCLTLL